jgi:hypothetical protein
MLKSLGQKTTVGEELGIIFIDLFYLTIWASKPIVPSHLKDDFTRSLFRPFLPGPFKNVHVTSFVNKGDSVMGLWTALTISHPSMQA